MLPNLPPAVPWSRLSSQGWIYSHLVDLADLGCNELGFVDDPIRPLQLHQLPLQRGAQLEAVPALGTERGGSETQIQQSQSCAKIT